MNIVITGASSGLGKCIEQAIRSWPNPLEAPGFDDPPKIIDWSLSTGVDVRQSDAVFAATAAIEGPIDILINCAGINDIDYLSNFDEDRWCAIMDTNAKGIFNTVRAALLFDKLDNGTVVNIVSNASHMPMTGSLAYNASKGAAHIMTLQLARELSKTHGVTVFGISPNKLAGTGMSDLIDARVQAVRGWTAEQARAYQLASLPAGEETDPNALAEFVAFLLSNKRRHKYLAGTVIPYGG